MPRTSALGIVSPDGRDGMLQHAREFQAAGIPFVFDPGQGLPMFNGEELMAFLKLADYCTVNDYEAKLLTERTGRTAGTTGNRGRSADRHAGRQRIAYLLPRAPHRDSRGAAGSLIDPTGCGDAYRAGLLYGIGQGWDWRRPAGLRR
jgi:adenosine kinase